MATQRERERESSPYVGRTAQNGATSHGIQDAEQDPDPLPIDDMVSVMGS